MSDCGTEGSGIKQFAYRYGSSGNWQTVNAIKQNGKYKATIVRRTTYKGTLEVKAIDNAQSSGASSNFESAVTSGYLMVDKTPPSCTSSGGNTNWINAASNPGTVILTGTCNDAHSGCKERKITKEYSTDIDSTTESPGIVYDNVGNSTVCPGNRTVKIDKTAPSCTNSGGSNTWTSGAITLIGTCKDNLSGCRSNVSKKYDYEINSTKESPGTVYDIAGNKTECPGNQSVKIDKTPPTCTSSGGDSTWTSGSRTLTGTCSDNLSGCRSNVTKRYDYEINSTRESPGTVYDLAGNKTVCPGNQTVKIDQTPPTCTSSGGDSTWTSGSRTLTGTCRDNLSGCQSNVSKQYNSEINSTSESPGTVYDLAGNKTVCPGNQTVKIDKTPPTCTSSGGDNAWTAGARILTGTCGDNLSGCRSNVTKRYDYQINSTTESPGTVYDNAGNSVTCPGNQTVRIDKTAPTCSSSGGSSSVVFGSITLTGTCYDNESGCQGNVSKNFSGPQTLYNQSPGTVCDNVGHCTTCPANQTINIGIPEIVGGNACQSGLNVVWTVHGSSAHGGGSGGCGSVSLRTNWEGSGNVSIDSNDIPTYGARKVIISGHGGMKHYDAISVCVSGQCRSASGENPDDVPDHTWSYEWNISGKSTIQISLSGRNQNDGDAFATINSIRFEM